MGMPLKIKKKKKPFRGFRYASAEGNAPKWHEHNSVKFKTKKEMNRWIVLCHLRDAGRISALQRQVRFPLEVNGVLICTYVADFTYIEDGFYIVEDAKGFVTDVYDLKRKLLKALKGITVRET